MRILDSPPPLNDLLPEIADNLQKLAGHIQSTDDQGRYLHWDELRRRPPPSGLDHRLWWAAIRLSRDTASTSLPVRDINDRAFTFCEPPRLRAALHAIDVNGAGILSVDAKGMTPVEGRRYLVRSLAEEPFSSSLIEGAATTREIAKQLVFEQRPARTRDERMVLNNYLGMEFAKSIADQDLTVSAILELHKIMTEGTLDQPDGAGVLRASDDVLVVDDSTGAVLHQPPRARDLPERLERLVAFANAKAEAAHYVHPIVKAIALHFMLAYEHPFVDGNGRTARALFYWQALRSGYWLTEFISISSVIAEAPIAYGKAFLHTETDASDLTYFLLHQAETVTVALERLQAYAARRVAEMEAFERRLAQTRGPDAFNHRQSSVLNDAARGRLSQIRIAEHQARHRVSYLTARSDLETLVEKGLFRKRRVGRDSIYTPAPNLVQRLGAPASA